MLELKYVVNSQKTKSDLNITLASGSGGKAAFVSPGAFDEISTSAEHRSGCRKAN
jgi:hypothetical protein